MTDSAAVVGNGENSDEVHGWIVGRFANCRSVFSLRELLSDPSEPPGLIVIFERSPDQYAPSEIQQVLEDFPLARIVVCQGPWCASSGRTRQVWPRAVCVPDEQVMSRLNDEWDVIQGRRAPLPLTAGFDEIFAFDHNSPAPEC